MSLTEADTRAKYIDLTELLLCLVKLESVANSQ